MNDPILPDNDIDVRLARRLGMLLEEKAPIGEGDGDPFVEILGQLKTTYQSTQPGLLQDKEASARMWRAINAATQPVQQTAPPKAIIFSLNPVVYRIAIAASFMAAIAISWMLFIKAPAPELLAAADQEISNFTLADGSTVALRPHSKLYSLTADESEDH